MERTEVLGTEHATPTLQVEVTPALPPLISTIRQHLSCTQAVATVPLANAVIPIRPLAMVAAHPVLPVRTGLLQPQASASVIATLKRPRKTQ